MTFVARTALVCLAASLMWGTQALGQEVDDGLRLETDDVFLDDMAEQPVPRRSKAITISDNELPVQRRKQMDANPYAAQGLPFGGLRLYPSLEIGSIVSSNVLKAATGKKGGYGVSVKPSVRLESDWIRHSFTANATAAFAKSLSGPDIKSLDGGGDVALRLDVRRHTRAELDVNYNAETIGEGSSELPPTAESGRLDQSFGGRAGIGHDFGGVEGALSVGVSRNLYGDVRISGGGKEHNSDREYTSIEVSARAQFKPGGALEPFLEAAYVPRFYDKKQDRNGTRRNSQGVRLRAGVAFADEPIWSGTLAATLEHRKYADASLDAATAPGLEASLTWRPTDLTRFEFNAGTSLSETISVGESATSNWTAGVRAIHALRENIDIYASLQEDIEKAAGSKDYTTTAGFGVDWTLNPFVVINAGYEGVFFNGKAPGTDYAEHRMLTSIVLRR